MEKSATLLCAFGTFVFNVINVGRLVLAPRVMEVDKVSNSSWGAWESGVLPRDDQVEPINADLRPKDARGNVITDKRDAWVQYHYNKFVQNISTEFQNLLFKNDPEALEMLVNVKVMLGQQYDRLNSTTRARRWVLF